MKRFISASKSLEEEMLFNDKYWPRVDINDKSRFEYYQYRGKDFAYDLKDNIVMELFKEDEEVAALGDGAPYRELRGVGLQLANWKKVATRKEYLDECIAENDFESEMLMQDFIKYELPYYQDNGDITGAYDTGEDAYDPELDNLDADDVETVEYEGASWNIYCKEKNNTFEIAPLEETGLYLWAKNAPNTANFKIYRSDNNGEFVDKMDNVTDLMQVVARLHDLSKDLKADVTGASNPSDSATINMVELERTQRTQVDYKGVTFRIKIDANETVWIESVHPYDLQEYHYAYLKKDGKLFRICRNGKLVTSCNLVDNYFEIIRIMYNLDSKLSKMMDRT